MSRERLTRQDAWALTGLILLCAALGFRNGALALLGGGLLAAAASVGLWQRYALARLGYRRVLGERRAFYGEELPFTVEIENRKALPLAWLEADDSIPTGLEVMGGPAAVGIEPGRASLRQLVALRWYERVRLSYTLRCAARGAYLLGPVHVRSGDPFGFAAREGVLSIFDRVLVYPRIVPVEQLGLPSRHPFGDARDPRRLFPDTTRLAGIRPYAPGDSPRHVHWKATARLQSLQTRVYEPTTSHTLMLYVNLASFEGFWWASLNRSLLELAITTAASVAKWGLDQGYHVGVSTNGAPAGGGEELGVPPAGDAQQLVRALDTLARISLFARTPLERLLSRDRARLPWGTTVVVISAVFPEPVLEVVQRLASLGHVPALLQIGDSAAARVQPGTVWYRVPEAAWDSVETLSPVRAGAA
ncbi:MAG TPA: DUF58 domain-containing protein [Chloroflexota bacterium]|nr:DUF58 domain-containing protein [Chloroflexota bacterium]